MADALVAAQTAVTATQGDVISAFGIILGLVITVVGIVFVRKVFR